MWILWCTKRSPKWAGPKYKWEVGRDQSPLVSPLFDMGFCLWAFLASSQCQHCELEQRQDQNISNDYCDQQFSTALWWLSPKGACVPSVGCSALKLNCFKLFFSLGTSYLSISGRMQRCLSVCTTRAFIYIRRLYQYFCCRVEGWFPDSHIWRGLALDDIWHSW